MSTVEQITKKMNLSEEERAGLFEFLTASTSEQAEERSEEGLDIWHNSSLIEELGYEDSDFTNENCCNSSGNFKDCLRGKYSEESFEVALSILERSLNEAGTTIYLKRKKLTQQNPAKLLVIKALLEYEDLVRKSEIKQTENTQKAIKYITRGLPQYSLVDRKVTNTGSLYSRPLSKSEAKIREHVKKHKTS